MQVGFMTRVKDRYKNVKEKKRQVWEKPGNPE